MPSLAPVAPLPEVAVPLNRFIPTLYQHYFNGHPERPHYRARRFDFWGVSEMMPLVRAFLDTCAAARDREYRYLFTLLGGELATNAIAHTRSGGPEGSYSLVTHRHPDGLRLTCRDEGDPDPDRRWSHHDRQYLTANPAGLDSDAESGRGLAIVEALSTSWGDSGRPSHRHVWFFLAYDLTGSAWAAC